MADQAWRIAGDYFETCSCDYVCPCIYTALTARPTQGRCLFAMVFHIDRGHRQGVALDGLNFAVIGQSPGAMADGNWSVGLVLDERADQSQREAIVAIGSGQAGGPMAAVAPLLGSFLGTEVKPIRFERDGMRRSVAIPGVLDQAVQGVPGGNTAEPVYLDNTPHPASSRLALARATRSHVHGFGLDWDETSGRNNGHFAPFAWQG